MPLIVCGTGVVGAASSPPGFGLTSQAGARVEPAAVPGSATDASLWASATPNRIRMRPSGNSQRAMGQQLRHGALVPAAGQAAPDPDPAANPHVVSVVIHAADPRDPPAPRVPSSRTIARMRERAEAEARNAAAAQGAGQAGAARTAAAHGTPVRHRRRPAAARVAGRGIGRSANHAHPGPASRRWQAPAGGAGGAAGGWQHEQAVREALAALAQRLAVIGLRVCRRKGGLRMAKYSAK